MTVTLLPRVLDLGVLNGGVEVFRDTEKRRPLISERRGESVEDPDFLITLTVTVNNPANLSEIKARGFSAPDPGQAS